MPHGMLRCREQLSMPRRRHASQSLERPLRTYKYTSSIRASGTVRTVLGCALVPPRFSGVVACAHQVRADADLVGVLGRRARNPIKSINPVNRHHEWPDERLGHPARRTPPSRRADAEVCLWEPQRGLLPGERLRDGGQRVKRLQINTSNSALDVRRRRPVPRNSSTWVPPGGGGGLAGAKA